MISLLTGKTAGNDAVQQEVGKLNQSLNDGLAAIEEFLRSQLEIATLSNELSKEFAAWDMPIQFENLKAVLNLAALSTLEGMTTVLGNTFVVQNELMNANTETTLITIAELLNMHMAALLLTETKLGTNNAALLMENNLYLASIVDAIAQADINNVDMCTLLTNTVASMDINNVNAVNTASQRLSVENAATQNSILMGFQGVFTNQTETMARMQNSHAETIEKLSSLIATNTSLISSLSSQLYADAQAIVDAQQTDTAVISFGIGTIITQLDTIINRFTDVLDFYSGILTEFIHFSALWLGAHGIIISEICAQVRDTTLAREANELAKEGNRLAKDANFIAWQSLAVSIMSAIIPFASGGFPTTGEMFIAREAGPELVGTIGGRSAVVNNNQIVEAVSNGVARAVAGVLGAGRGGQNVQVFIGNEQLDSYIVRSQRRQALRTNGAKI